jgi:hypothetical protein
MRALTDVLDDGVGGVAIRTVERRAHLRGTVAEPERRHLVPMIVGTYREMPGLSLHLNQAARLFGLRQTICRIALDDLVRSRQLHRATDGQYIS